ncbi:kinase-like domain-containing protein [Xylariales sp. AK1849]|nr:kinase-like domain-containing protein [Xylariales sp. AK1849]
MNRRSDLRGTHGTHISSSRPSRNLNDAHYNQSPTHVASGSSYYGSPIAQSPHGGGGRAGRNGQQQYSPQGGTPTGPQAHFNQSPSHTPTGPMNSGRGFSRGGFRGGSFSSARGGSRGGGSFKPPTGPAAERGHLSRSGENTPNHSSPRYPASNHSDAMALTIDDPGDEQSSRLSKDVQAEDPVPDKDNDEQMPPPTRAPPTGPAAGTPSGPKFSFAFKATSKAPVAAPKPEISQKFSAAPPRREPQPVDDRSNRDRDLPRGTPTEPASSRARSDYNRQRQSEPPRTRVVKRIEQQLKPKPILPEHLATSDSPFYRKPGNESVVGSGTYGKVFKGMQIYSGRLVALKKIRMEGERDGFPVTAVREIKLLQSLRHENIVALQEVMVEKNDCFMVFEYLSHDLTGLLNHPSFKLDPAQRKHLAKQLFEGLDYLHTRGVLHRDIKAANILVSSDGILKLADFGLARFYAKHHQNDYTNRVITIWYRSPELLLGETQYNAAVDVWSAACVMVEIFTRHAIFPGDGTEINQLDKIYAVLGTPNKVDWPDLIKMEWFELLRPSYRKPNVFAEKYRDRVPLAAFELLTSMFQYDPAKRPSASEVLADPYFTTEQPPPRQATELADIKGDWHEFESKALRREKEKQEREARRTASSKKETEKTEKDRKRPGSSHDVRDSKRLHIEGQPLSTGKPSGAAVA